MIQSPKDRQQIGRPIRDFYRTGMQSRRVVHLHQLLWRPEYASERERRRRERKENLLLKHSAKAKMMMLELMHK